MEGIKIGYIYCFSNISFIKNLYKIGFTERTPEERVGELYRTGIPSPFKVEIQKKVVNPHEKEQILHDKFNEYRYNPDRDFFEMDLELIKKGFDKIKSFQDEFDEFVLNNNRHFTKDILIKSFKNVNENAIKSTRVGPPGRTGRRGISPRSSTRATRCSRITGSSSRSTARSTSGAWRSGRGSGRGTRRR